MATRVPADWKPKLAEALEHQAPIMLDPARNKVVCAGRRFGKTLLCLKVALQGHGPSTPTNVKGNAEWMGAMLGGRIWWLAPVYAQAAPVWQALKNATRPASSQSSAIFGQPWKSEVERTVWFPSGGSISVKTADDPDNLRGSGLDGVILDECAFMKETTWTQVIRPALIDRGGWAFFISTPNGMNWFHDLFESATREGWARWQEPTWANPIISMAEIDEMRNDPRVSKLSFQQEIEAQFVTAGAGMFDRANFRYFDVTEEDGERYYDLGMGEHRRRFMAHTIVPFATVDLAVTTKTTSHYTVISTWGATPDADVCLLDVDRFKAEAPHILPRIQQAFAKWRHSYIGIEKVGFQLALIQQALLENLPVRELSPDRDKVARAMTAVALMEKGKVWWPKGTTWMKDLEDEVAQFPEGEFDDFVDTLSYACIEIVSSRFAPVVKPQGIFREAPWSIK